MTRPGAEPLRPDWVFFDGGCGLCHAVVRFVIRADDRGVFAFAPIGGETYVRVMGSRLTPPGDTVVVVRGGSASPNTEVLVRSSAIAHILRELGWPWSWIAAGLRLAPERMADTAYAAVARVRARIARPPPGSCPRLPPSKRDRVFP